MEITNTRFLDKYPSLPNIDRQSYVKLLAALGIGKNTKILELDSKILDYVEYYIFRNYGSIDTYNKRKLSNINHLIGDSTIRGIRHHKRLPVNGQKTRRKRRKYNV